MRVVADTNVLISALAFPGGNADLVLRMARRGEIELITSPFILAEFKRVLEKKFGHTARRAAEAARMTADLATVVEPAQRISVIKEKDADNRILEAAVAGKAEVVVTGDTKHLLPLTTYGDIKIMSPAEFVKRAPWIRRPIG